MLSINESYRMTFKEDWETSNIWIEVTGHNAEEMAVMREFILKGFDEIEKRKKK